MPEGNEYSVSPRSGRLRKKMKVRHKKKRPFFSKKRIWKLIFNPITVLAFVALLAAITYFLLPPNKPDTNKWKVRTDEKTKEVNKRLKETDVY